MKKQIIRNNVDKHQEELTDRLRHYNDWLMDPNREFPSVYPGYPGDEETEKESEVKIVPPVTKRKEKSVMSITTVGVKVQGLKAPKPGTKQAKAIEIVEYLGVTNKHDAIATIMDKLSMSKAGATTYFHNARHYLDNKSAVNA